jgi:hypothetical protein
LLQAYDVNMKWTIKINYLGKKIINLFCFKIDLKKYYL